MTQKEIKLLESMGFIKSYGENDNFSYYHYTHNDITLYTSATDEDFKVYIEDSQSYWKDIDDVKSMISFLHNTQID